MNHRHRHRHRNSPEHDARLRGGGRRSSKPDEVIHCRVNSRSHVPRRRLHHENPTLAPEQTCKARDDRCARRLLIDRHGRPAGFRVGHGRRLHATHGAAAYGRCGRDRCSMASAGPPDRHGRNHFRRQCTECATTAAEYAELNPVGGDGTFPGGRRRNCGTLERPQRQDGIDRPNVDTVVQRRLRSRPADNRSER